MRARKTLRRQEKPVSPGLTGLPALLARVYANRGVQDVGEVDNSLNRMTSLDEFAGLAPAAKLLEEGITAGRHILIVGDFDTDGATSTALMVLGLRAMGARQVDYLVPNRFEYGYGLTPEIVAVADERFGPDLLVTVDNGVSSIEGVKAARAAGMRVLVTDHHLPGESLPPADALVDPNLLDEPFPVKGLAGVGVAFYVLAALRRRMRANGRFEDQGIEEPNLADLLDLVALGTVADVVPLARDNRILVEQGLRRIRQGACRPGITALLTVAKRDPARATAADLGFAVAPRLNAAGRLSDMSFGIECLLCDDPVEAARMASELDAINRERREIEAGMQARALEILEGLGRTLEADAMPNGLCLYDEGWHQGVIGILASRIRERIHRPVIAFADAGEGEIKGSARSIPGLHIRDILDEVAACHPGLVTRFGGHAMAAGLSLPAAHLDRFAIAFEETIGRHVVVSDLEGVVVSDGALDAAELTLDNACLLREAGPWGQSFAEPVFDGDFRIVEKRLVGQDGSHLRLQLACVGNGLTHVAMVFKHDPADWPGVGETVKIAYRLAVDEWNGRSSLRLLIEHVEH